MRILITGGYGLVGRAFEGSIVEGHEIIRFRSADCDLRDFYQTYAKFKEIGKIDCIIHLAANVGGLFKNMREKVAMIEDNLLINYNVIRCAHLCEVQNMVSCLSTCIFPDKVQYPINEDVLMNGPPHTSNEGYAYVKRMIEVQSKAYREQYGRNYFCIIPTNIYGEWDNYNLEDSHVIPGLIHKCYLAKKNREKFIVRGSGKPLRQFIYSRDLAELIMWSINHYTDGSPIILSVGEEDEVSIGDIAGMIADEFDYREMMEFDESFSDGQFKKTADNSRLMRLIGGYQFTPIQEGIKKSVKWFVENYNIVRGKV